MTKTNEELIEEFTKEFTEPHPIGRTMYARHVQPTDRLINYVRTILTQKDAEVQKSALAVLAEMQAYADKHELEEVRKTVEMFKNDLTNKR